MSTYGPTDPGAGAYGPGGYVAGFGNFETPAETLEDQRNRLQQQSGKFSAEAEDEDLGEMDWTVTYIDMVTLLMIFFVVLSFLAMVSDKSRLNTQSVEQVQQTALPAPPDTTAIPEGTYSPFDGHGFTMVEGGMPANRDNIHSRYDDPDAENGTTDASSPALAVSPPPPAVTTSPALPTAPPAVETPSVNNPPPGPETQNPAQNALAEQLQRMVQQSDLAGQVEVISGAQSVTVRISEKILFASGRASLEESGIQLVARLAPVLAKSPDAAISIEGHTDNVPISTMVYPSNWELSAARASTVLRQLVGLGLSASRLRAIAYADTRPVGPNDSPEHRATNRRVELVITTDKR